MSSPGQWFNLDYRLNLFGISSHLFGAIKAQELKECVYLPKLTKHTYDECIQSQSGRALYTTDNFTTFMLTNIIGHRWKTVMRQHHISYLG